MNVAIETRQDGVVGIDMLGDVFGITSEPHEKTTKNGTKIKQDTQIFSV